MSEWIWVACGSDGGHMFNRRRYFGGTTRTDVARCGATPAGYAHSLPLAYERTYRRFTCAACWALYVADEEAAEKPPTDGGTHMPLLLVGGELAWQQVASTPAEIRRALGTFERNVVLGLRASTYCPEHPEQPYPCPWHADRT